MTAAATIVTTPRITRAHDGHLTLTIDDASATYSPAIAAALATQLADLVVASALSGDSTLTVTLGNRPILLEHKAVIRLAEQLSGHGGRTGHHTRRPTQELST